MENVLFGANRFVGTASLREAPPRGDRLIALVQEPQKAPALHRGAHARQGDYADTTTPKRRPTLAMRALAGCLGLGLLLSTACSKDSDSDFTPTPTPLGKEALRASAIGFYQALYSPAPAPTDAYVAAAYTEHQLGTGYTLAGLKAYAAARTAGAAATRLTVHRTLVQGNLVGLHLEERVTADSSVARMALLRFDDQGRIVDHWEAVQGQPRRRANPHTMFDGGPVNYQSNSGVIGRDVAIAADLQAFNAYDTLIVRQSRALTYVQHNPLARDGASGLIQLLMYLKSTGSKTVLTSHQRLAEGDCVMTLSHSQTTPAVPGFTDLLVFDLFRLNDAGKDTEHWDVLQELNGADQSKVF